MLTGATTKGATKGATKATKGQPRNNQKEATFTESVRSIEIYYENKRAEKVENKPLSKMTLSTIFLGITVETALTSKQDIDTI